MAELKITDLMEIGLVEAPLKLNKNIQTLIKTLDSYKNIASSIKSSTDTATKSFIKLGEENKKVIKLSNDFAKAQQGVQIEVKKNNDAIAKQSKTNDESTTSIKKQTNAMTALRKEYNDTKGELVRLSQTTGTNTKAFQDAALKAGKLKDEINDINDAIKNTSASPFENMATQLGNVGSKLISMDFEGAKNAAQQFAATSKTITFAEAGKGIKDVGIALYNVGKAILTNPLFLIAAAVTAIGAAFVFMKTQADKAFSTTAANADKTIKRLQEQYDLEIRIAEIQGKDTLEKKLEKQINLKKEADLALAKLGSIFETDVTQTLLTASFIRGKLVKKENEEKKAQIKNLLDISKSAANEIIVITEEIKQAAKKKEEEQRKKDNEESEKKEVEAAKKKEEKIQRAKYRVIVEANIKLLEEHKKGIEQVLKYEFKSNEDELKGFELYMAKKIEAVKKLNAEQEKELNGFSNQRIAKAYKTTETISSIEQDLANGIGSIMDSVLYNRIQTIELEKTALENSHREQLIDAGDNKRAQLQVEKDYQEKKAALNAKELAEKIKVAKFDKATALFNASLQEALFILKALSGDPKAIAAAIGGGFQVAAIAAKKLPKYEKGTQNSIGGAAIINEVGKELIVNPDGSGKIYDTPGATLATLKQGSKVYTAEETAAIMGGGYRNGASMPNFTEVKKNNLLLKEISGLRHDMKNKKHVEINISRDGVELMLVKAESRTKFLNDFYA